MIDDSPSKVRDTVAASLHSTLCRLRAILKEIPELDSELDEKPVLVKPEPMSP